MIRLILNYIRSDQIRSYYIRLDLVIKTGYKPTDGPVCSDHSCPLLPSNHFHTILYNHYFYTITHDVACKNKLSRIRKILIKINYRDISNNVAVYNDYKGAGAGFAEVTDGLDLR